jgi:hypothetical protein
MNSIVDEALELMASGYTPEVLIAFKPSEAASRHFEDLIAREKNEGLLPEETAELDRMMEMERVLSLAKARARLKLKEKAA